MTANIIKRFSGRWRGDGGYRELLTLALPLIVSTGSWSIQHFVDRMFLAWYTPEAIAAVMPAGILSFAVSSTFIGLAGFVSTFTAQYDGAGRPSRTGAALWQGIYVALIAGLLELLLIIPAGPFFNWVGHAPEIRASETIYFQIMCTGAFPAVAASAMSGFLSGLGKAWPVMWVNILVTLVNCVFDYLLIFGRLGFPEMGIAGAAIATVFAFWVNAAAYALIIFRSEFAGRYATLRNWRPDRKLFLRLVRFGFPHGISMFVDVAGFTIFILLMGRLGTVNLAASNIAFNINTLAFMPMIGIGIAVSVLVGRRLGEGDPALAGKTTLSGFHLSMLYMCAISFFYVALPEIFVGPFAARSDPRQFGEILELAKVLLRFVALYSLFDSMSIIFSSCLRGAGDTRFVMMMMALLSLFVLVLPGYVGIVHFGMGVYGCWIVGTAYVIILGFSFYFRFRSGKWKSMRVIEHAAPKGV